MCYCAAMLLKCNNGNLLTSMQEKNENFHFFQIRHLDPTPLKRPFLHKEKDLLNYFNIYLSIRHPAVALTVKNSDRNFKSEF